MAYFDNPHKKAMWEKELKGLQRDKEKNLTQQSEERTAAKAHTRISSADNRPYRNRITYEALIEKELALSGAVRKSRIHDKKAEHTKSAPERKAPERKAPERQALARPALTLSAPRQM